MAAKKASTAPKRTTKKKTGEEQAGEAASGESSGSTSPLPASDDLERRLAGMHSSGTAVADGKSPADPVADSGTPGLKIDTRDSHRTPPVDEEIEEALAGLAPSTMADTVRRALRFVEKTAPFISLFPNMVVGSGPKGTVMAPWATSLIGNHVVDGVKLLNALRACGAEAKLVPMGDGGIKVQGNGERYQLRPYAGTIADHLAVPADVKYVVAKPASFRQAKLFAADEKNADPFYLSGIGVEGSAAMATDRRGALMAGDFTDAKLPSAVLPSTLFDDIADDAVYFAVTEHKQAIVAVPSTGEYRIVRALGDSFPDLKKALDMYEAQIRYVVEVPKAKIQEVLRKLTVVQSRLSAVDVSVQQAVEAATGIRSFWITFAGGMDGVADFETTFQVTASGIPADAMGLVIKMHVKADLVQKLCKAALGENLRLCFGSDDRTPLLVAEASYRALALAFVV